MTINGVAISKIAFAGICTGTLDILAAFADVWLSYGRQPVKVLKYIGSAAFDSSVFSDSFLVISGLIIHYTIAMVFTFLFCLIYPYLKLLFTYTILIAVLYGLFIQVVMRLGILPLTRLHLAPLDITKQLKPTLILIGAFGLPLSFFMRVKYKPPINQAAAR